MNNYKRIEKVMKVIRNENEKKCQQTNAESKRFLIVDDKYKRKILTNNRKSTKWRNQNFEKCEVDCWTKKINKQTNVDDDDDLMSILLKKFVVVKNWMKLIFARCFD